MTTQVIAKVKVTPVGPSAIVFCGVPYSHAELIAAATAEAIGYGHINLRTTASQLHNLSMDAPVSEIAHCINLELKGMQDDAREISHRTFSCTYPGSIHHNVLEDLAEAHPQVHFVWIQTGRRLVDFGTTIWKLDSAEVEEFEVSLESSFSKIPQSQQTRLTLTDAELFPRPSEHIEDSELSEYVANAIVDASLSAAKTFIEKDLNLPFNEFETGILNRRSIP